MQVNLKQIEDGITYFHIYSTDTTYKSEERQRAKEDSNYYSTLKYRRRETNYFDKKFYNNTFGTKIGKVTGVW